MSNFRDRFYDKNDILVAVVIILIAAAIIAIKIDNIMEYPETLVTSQASQTDRETSEGITVTVSEGATVDQIATQLETAGVVSSASDFLNAVKVKETAGVGVTVVPGSYVFKKDMSVEDILDKLAGK